MPTDPIEKTAIFEEFTPSAEDLAMFEAMVARDPGGVTSLEDVKAELGLA
jgi:hypothetical protein